jgi:NADP-dependent 3-hydroxy acid dehydrogenase YdfG
MTKTIAVFGAGPGLGRSVARRFGQEGFRTALVARNRERLEGFVEELAAEGIEAAAFTADLADREALIGTVEAITARFGQIDVLEYAPASVNWISDQIEVRDAVVDSFETPLDVLFRAPVALVREVLPGMIERGDGAVLFGLSGSAGVPFPQMSTIGAAGAAARSYLHDLHVSLAGTGVYAGMIQIAGMVGDSDAAKLITDGWDADKPPVPLDPADLAGTLWDLYSERDRFEEIIPKLAA